MSPGKRHFRDRARAAWKKGQPVVKVPSRWLDDTLDTYTRWKVAALTEAALIAGALIGVIAWKVM